MREPVFSTGRIEVRKPVLVLFDIDQTLMSTAGAGMKSLAQAVEDVLGVDVSSTSVTPDGRTDPTILRDILREAEMAWADPTDVWDRYAAILADTLSTATPERFLHPGVFDLVTALYTHPEARLAVLTGNLERTARIKLGAFGLNKFFPVGAFGSDSEERTQLGPIAVSRATKHYLLDFRLVWVVGDTTNDVEVAKVLGARCLGVATGRTSVEALKRAGADETVPNLAAVSTLLDLFLA